MPLYFKIFLGLEMPDRQTSFVMVRKEEKFARGEFDAAKMPPNHPRNTYHKDPGFAKTRSGPNRPAAAMGVRFFGIKMCLNWAFKNLLIKRLRKVKQI